MTTSNETIGDYHALAHALADAAGDVLRRHFRARPQAEGKADGSPVTQADREAESAMRALIAERFPTHGIFGEEQGRERVESPLQWVLDPIDGTRPFMAGYPTFTILIALLKDGAPLLGIVDQPVLRERWSAVSGANAFFNGQRVQASAQTPEKLTLATTSWPYFTEAQAEAFEHAANGHILIPSGDAYAYAMLASGHIHAVIDAGMKPYDFCALAPIVSGADGVITDWQGAPLRLDSRGDVLAAANPEIHASLLEILRHA